jgi:hypothetical protein
MSRKPKQPDDRPSEDPAINEAVIAHKLKQLDNIVADLRGRGYRIDVTIVAPEKREEH